nr:AbrB family transcriptional regulator [Verticiella sp. GG226]
MGASWALARILVGLDFGAGILVGPMLVAMAMGMAGASIDVPRPAFNLAQALTGCVVASTLDAGVLMSVLGHWWQMLLTVGTTVAAATVIGWALMRYSPLPGTTGAWGTLPGAAPAMAAMADQYGGDSRMVAVMQYLRVALVVGSGSVISHALLGVVLPAPPAEVLPVMGLGPPRPADMTQTLLTLAVATGGAYIGVKMRIMAGAILVPMLLGALLNVTGVLPIAVHGVLLAGAFGIIGWTIGLKFRRELARPLLHALPAMACGIVALMGVCAVSAWVLTRVMPIDAVTAYLATTPGGLDSVAVIALGAQADLATITALQTLRLFVVVLLGPAIARALSARHVARLNA